MLEWIEVTQFLELMDETLTHFNLVLARTEMILATLVDYHCWKLDRGVHLYQFC